MLSSTNHIYRYYQVFSFFSSSLYSTTTYLPDLEDPTSSVPGSARPSSLAFADRTHYWLFVRVSHRSFRVGNFTVKIQRRSSPSAAEHPANTAASASTKRTNIVNITTTLCGPAFSPSLILDSNLSSQVKSIRFRAPATRRLETWCNNAWIEVKSIFQGWSGGSSRAAATPDVSWALLDLAVVSGPRISSSFFPYNAQYTPVWFIYFIVPILCLV